MCVCNREDYQNCSVLYRARQLRTMIRTLARVMSGQFLNLHIGLRLDFVIAQLFRFSIFVFLCQLRSFYSVLFAFLVLHLVSKVPRQEISWDHGTNVS